MKLLNRVMVSPGVLISGGFSIGSESQPVYQQWVERIKSNANLVEKFAKINKADKIHEMNTALGIYEEELENVQRLIRHTMLSSEDLMLDFLSKTILKQA